jgi:hypothetical protein
MADLYQATTYYFCCGVLVSNDTITDTGPILNWAIGLPLWKLKRWLKSKNGTLEKLDET